MLSDNISANNMMLSDNLLSFFFFPDKFTHSRKHETLIKYVAKVPQIFINRTNAMSRIFYNE
jgi:hypothetical protein